MGLFSRLHAWWEGYDDGSSPDDGDVDAGGGERSDVAPGELKTWTRRRLRAAQRLCGAGRSYPGGAQALSAQLDRLDLSDGHVVGSVGAGLGEIATTLAARANIRLTCVDPDTLLMRAARELVEEAGLSGRIAFSDAAYDGEALGPQTCDAIVAREALLEAKNKPDALRALHAGLKPGGSLLLFDFMDKSGSGATLDVSVWSAFERTSPHLVGVDEYSATLAEFGYEVGAVEDIGGDYCRTILQTLHQFAGGLEEKPVADDLRPWLMWEVEYWARRAQLLEGGEVGYFALQAKLPEG